ncbi:hypothetical protein GLAREA_02131 [Glarea lozoyensis ATCC 20868]|uniref:Uncharacterized protein n=1 Tax=Glarea lozoyensis (strain ATCC 20868 / MF5171) TaxID=1116229 RepID=S3CLZ4_GLAL2|nr:uncharacterized protein GLAREA_02131 [Glarea lozoyensis ATCC 20868]EPE26219.1 hypothetical protein GLAREA_02131 [Glarea lozoyensis ATCC 20868]
MLLRRIRKPLNQTDGCIMSSPESHDNSSDNEPCWLLKLPREIRDMIWTLVLEPTVLFSVDTRPMSLQHGYRLNYGEEFCDTAEYMQNYTNFLLLNIGVGPPPTPPICKKVTFGTFAINGYRTDGEERLDRTAYIQKLFDFYFPEDGVAPPPGPPRCENFEFDCHPYEIYSFLETTSAAFLKNIRSIVLGEHLVSDDLDFFSEYCQTKLTLEAAEPFRSVSQLPPYGLGLNRVYPYATPDLEIDYHKYKKSRIIQLLDSQLPCLKEVALCALLDELHGFFYPIVVPNFLRMLIAGRIDNLQLLYDYSGDWEPPILSERRDMAAFFVEKINKFDLSPEIQSVFPDEVSHFCLKETRTEGLTWWCEAEVNCNDRDSETRLQENPAPEVQTVIDIRRVLLSEEHDDSVKRSREKTANKLRRSERISKRERLLDADKTG